MFMSPGERCRSPDDALLTDGNHTIHNNNIDNISNTSSSNDNTNNNHHSSINSKSNSIFRRNGNPRPRPRKFSKPVCLIDIG